MVALGCPQPRCAYRKKSALMAVPMEDIRQPAALSRTRGVDPAFTPGLDGIVSRLVLDPLGARDHPDSFAACLFAGTVSEAKRCASGPAPRCQPVLRRPALCPGGIYARLPSLRGVFQSRCDCAHRL